MQTEIIRQVLNFDAKKLSDLLSYMSFMDFEDDDDDVEIQGFRFSDKPQTREEIVAELNEIVDDVKKGNFISCEKGMSEIKQMIEDYECCMV